MRLGAGLTTAEFALLSRLRAARRTSHYQSVILLGFHTSIMHNCSQIGWSIVTILTLATHLTRYTGRLPHNLFKIAQSRIGKQIVGKPIGEQPPS